MVVDLLVDDLAKGYDTGDDAPYHTLSEGRFPRLEGLAYEPAFLLTGETPEPGENPRDALGRMLTEHPQFARATVNLVWGKLMTVAFVEPYNSFDLDRMGRLAAGEDDPLPSRPPQSRVDGGAGRGLPGQWVQFLAPGQDHHEVRDLRAFPARGRRLGRCLDRLLPRAATSGC